MNEIEIYKSANNKIELRVNLDKDTVWLTQEQIALLFGTQRPAITKHLNNIFKSSALNEKVDRLGNISKGASGMCKKCTYHLKLFLNGTS